MFVLHAALLSLTLLLSSFLAATASDTKRQVVLLNGTWQVAEGTTSSKPGRFEHKVPVPGLLDMANPSFGEFGVKGSGHKAFWYKRSFPVDGPIPAVALLKVNKAMFGMQVYLNGTLLGEHLPCFTPGYFDAKKALHTGENEIIIRVGASRENVPAQIPSGFDYEKNRYIPGIYDSVELIMTGAPSIARVQAVPDLEKKSVTVHAWLRQAQPSSTPLHFIIREAAGSKVVGEGQCKTESGAEEATGEVTISISSCHLWSPEDPFLYELETDSEGDTLKTRFGMRSFSFDPQSGRAILNGKPYFMRGSNVTLYRFFEDSQRGDRPWREEWVRRLHKSFREMHWNCLRYCIGFPPEDWYRIADEEGFLIQDEFPIWNMDAKDGDYDIKELAGEYKEWMQERWNHPCVVIWDACNETKAKETGDALALVRNLDYSKRPWDNGWSAAVDAGDSHEMHPYHFFNSNVTLKELAFDPESLDWKPGVNPIIVNEYGWLWLNRDGTPTSLTRQLYENLLGSTSTEAQRRELYARYLAADTEFFRSHRACAAVMHFCGLGYSRPSFKAKTPEAGATSDHWDDVEKLTYEPQFFNYVRDSFAPVGIMIDSWDEDYPAGEVHKFPINVINDLPDEWQGKVRLCLLGADGKVLNEEIKACSLGALGKATLEFNVIIPEKIGSYRLEASLLHADDAAVRSLRDFSVLSPQMQLAHHGLAGHKPVKASSNVSTEGATTPEAAVDGRHDTRWCSAPGDAQWFSVDLEKLQQIGKVVLDWDGAYAKNYDIEVSSDGSSWTLAKRVDKGKGVREIVTFEPRQARFVRMKGIKAATKGGYSLQEFNVFPGE